MTWTHTLRERWWLAPIAILVVAAAIVIRIITTPLEVSANVNDGDQAVPRTATIDRHFNQDMKGESVQHAFTMTPPVMVAFKAVGPREFQFRPTMKPNTAYHVSLKDAQNTSGRGVSSGFSFKTEPAPAVAAVVVDNNAVADGQQAVNRKQDPMAADWKFSFTTIIQVPSQGDPARIGSGAPVIVQIENSTAARPQAGMQQADMIYEYESEGNVPRLSAVYWHPLPELVGPVRSCRLITIRLELMYHGMIYCSGANDYILGMVWKHPNLVNDYSHGWGNVFYRENSTRYAPHNVMMHGNNTTTYTAQQRLGAPNYDIAPKHPDATFTGDPAPQISVPDHGATWHHPDPNVPAVYLDANGNPIELDNGLTWVHVIGSEKWHGVG